MEIELKIDDIAFGGQGVGRIEKKVCFVPGTCPGETVLTEIINEKKTFSIGRPLEIIEPSPFRIEPACPHAVSIQGRGPRPPVCPGCSYQHLVYSEELKVKDRQFREQLSRIAGIRTEMVLPPESSKEEIGRASCRERV